MKSRHSASLRALALLLCALQGPWACVPAPVVTPESGTSEYRGWGRIEVPGGSVDAVGGNLMLEGVAISVDTPLGAQRIQPIWNSASGAWQWSQRVRYDGSRFVDASGAALDAAGVSDGALLPGSGWLRLGASSLATRGGLAWHFAPDGSLAVLRWATLDYPRLVFTPTLISQCVAASSCAPLFELELHASGQPTQVRDARSGRTALYDYDAAGRLIAARSPADVAEGRPGTRYEYEGSQLRAVTGSEGQRVEYSYQAGGRIRRVIQRGEGDPTDSFEFYGRNAWGQHRTLHRNPLGGETCVYFDEQRRVLRVERYATGENVLLEWQGLRPTRVVDPAGVAVRMTWSGERLATLTTAGGNLVRFDYKAGALSPEDPLRDPIARVADSLGLVEARSYDDSGRPIAVTNGAGELRELSWNGANLSGYQVAGSAIGFPVFGVHGHWLDAVSGGEVLARRAFDPVGNETLPPDGLRSGGTLGVRFDADRRVVGLEVAASDDSGHAAATAEISLTRRSDGEPSAIARPGGGDSEWVRDALGRAVVLRERSQGVWRETRSEYDLAGNEVARELANGMREEWQRDVYGRVIRHRALRGGALEGEESFTWQSGRLVARSDSLRGEGEVRLYDAAGRTSAVVFGHGETISYSYDLRDRQTAEVYSMPGAGVVADIGTSYDAADRRVGLVDRSSGDTLMTWSVEDGRLVASVAGNGLRRSVSYDALGRVAGFETRDAQGGLVESTSVSRLIEPNPPRLEIASATTTSVAATEERYWLPPGSSLASPDQRIGKRVFGWSDGAGAARRYAWDELGNRAGDTHGNAFGYDAERTRLLSATLADEGVALSYVYDEAGFAVSRGGVPLEWSASGRLLRHGDDRVRWDMAGRPIAVTEAGVTREFALFGGRVESTLSSLGALDLGDVVISLGGGARRWRHFDFRGQVSFVSDEGGDVVAHYRYQPFGVDAAFGPESGGDRFENRPGFGPFYLLGQRVLDPLVGRFLSPDPVMQLTSAYSYALGNPIGFMDSDGRITVSRSDLTKAADVLEQGGKISGGLAVIFSFTPAGRAFAVASASMIIASSGIRIYLILTANRNNPKLPPPLPGTKTSIQDIVPGTTFSAPTGVGCAPLALARSDELGRLLLPLLLVNVLVALAWRRQRNKGGSKCVRP